jgi:hypothetical protein
LAVVLVVVGVWAALVASRGVDADRKDRAGLASLEAAKTELTRNHAISAGVLADVHSAGDDFGQASQDLKGPLIGWARVVPIAGTQLDSLRDLTGSARQASSVVYTSLTQVQAALNAKPHSGPGLLNLIRTVTQVATTANTQLSRLDLGPARGLVSPLFRSRAKLVKDLDQVQSTLHKISVGGSATSALLGGPDHYLVMVANNAEMRDGSGMMLEAGSLTADGGTLSLGQLQPTPGLLLPRGEVPVTGDLGARWGWLDPGSEWRNLALTPRFDVTAQLASQMWAARTGQTVQGVIVVDDQAIAAMLSATAPVNVAGTEVNGSNAVAFLMLGEYEGAFGAPEASGRVNDLGLLAHAALSQLTSGGVDVVALANGLSQAISGRHLMLWSPDAGQEADWEQLGAAGQIGPTSLELAVDNTGGDKLDQFLRVQSALSFTRAGANVNGRLAVTVFNNVPGGLPTYVEGPDPGAGTVAGEYAGLVAVNLPGAATAVSPVGFKTVPVNGPDGPTWVVAVPVHILAGQSAQVVVTFRLPGRAGSLVVEPSARIPITTWQVGSASFTDATAHQVSW